jgi:DNA-binding NarL/FixJ family response regulator
MLPTSEVVPVHISLTPRERQLLNGILEGRTNREIAAALGLTEQTVKNQLTMLFQKVGVRNRLELALYALKYRLTN